MKLHTGMRPHDIPILVKVHILQDVPWLMKDVSSSLYISPSEVSESLNRSKIAGLIGDEKKQILGMNFLEFLFYGVRYVFPQPPGAITRGVLTAHSHPDIAKKFVSDSKCVWPYAEGKQIGAAVQPFYPNQPKAALQDDRFYLIMALIDMIRIGRTREVKYAREQLKKIFRIE